MAKDKFALLGTKGVFAVETKEREGKIVPRKVGETKNFNLYFCRSENFPKRQFILKVSKTIAENPALDREAYILHELRIAALRIDAELVDSPMNYQIGFPEVIDSFISEEQGERRVLVLGFDIGKDFKNADGEDDLSLLLPISRIRTRNKERVDPKTSAWILGKALKFLVFFHYLGISVGNLSGGNILIDKEHYVTFFDWSDVGLDNDGVSSEVACSEISRLAREVITLLTGDPDAEELLDDEHLPDGRYEKFLFALADGKFESAKRAHKEFYELVENMWGRKFHPYTTYPL